MRPIKLILEGFTAFREFTAVSFDGAELFALTGPTGSGKSSIIDAITFALYGSVPRYQNPNLVHPVISQGKVEAKVQFDFALGKRTYTAVRVVRRTPKGGASTKEARLESGGNLLAGAADEVSRAVLEILGLNFEQFTTCVVLPQGDFARFLHEKPAQRQDLLTKLLGVDIYERMGNLARAREAAAKQRAQVLAEELDTLTDASYTARKSATRRVREIEGLVGELERIEPELESLEQEFRAQRERAESLEQNADLLRNVRIPKGVDELSGRIDEARRTAAKAREKREAADGTLTAAETSSSSHPNPLEIEQTLRTVDERNKRLALKEQAHEELDAARARRVEAEQARKVSERRVKDTRATVEAARRDLSAHDLASKLHQGDTCPVCRQVLESVPALTMPPALADTEKALADAELAHADQEKQFRTAEKGVTLAAERLRSLTSEVAAIDDALPADASSESLKEQRDAALQAAARLEHARAGARTARAEEQAALDLAARLSDEEGVLWRRFDVLRDAVAALGPPQADRGKLGTAWTALAEWARELERKKLRDGLAAADMAKSAAEAKKNAMSELDKRAKIVGVQLEKDRPRDAVVTLLAEAKLEEKRVADAIERAAELRAKLEGEKDSARVAGTLGQHLRATGFERWLLEAAFRRLAEGATLILHELSGGQYSFDYDDKLNFEVIDHRNADERRSARTLSGGETFLASLALALTLSEQTAELAAGGASRLESLFLDEGFGTLDNDTLEVVATAIEELGARGLVVGLVTHQANLAEKMPVQFKVEKGPITATVERVSS